MRNFHPYEYGVYADKKKSEWLENLRKSKELPTSVSLEDQLYGNTVEVQPETIVKDVETFEYPTTLPYCMRLDEIDEEHAIVKYVIDRKIPRNKWHRLFFTTNFIKLANYASPNMYKIEYPEPRLVIPIYNENGGIESFQGRALKDGARDKYLTVKFNENATKIYGLDTVDPSKTAYFLEGQIDSLFIDNGLAITGGNISTDEIDRVYKGDRAFIMDNEDRHPDTIQRIEKLLRSGEKIVLFDKVSWKGKDINQFVIDGISIREINEYIKANTLEGAVAMARFIAWKNVDVGMVKHERRERYRNDHRERLLEKMMEKLK